MMQILLKVMLLQLEPKKKNPITYTFLENFFAANALLDNGFDL